MLGNWLAGTVTRIEEAGGTAARVDNAQHSALPPGGRGHEAYQRVTHGLLHGIFGSTVEREAQFSVLDASAGRPTTPRRADRAPSSRPRQAGLGCREQNNGSLHPYKHATGLV
jgi:hypothetical protein